MKESALCLPKLQSQFTVIIGGKEHCPWSVAQLRGKFFSLKYSASQTIMI